MYVPKRRFYLHRAEGVQNGWVTNDTMTIEVIAPDAREIRAFDATSYTVHADGGLDVALTDGSVVTFAVEEWADVRRG
jgi:hypothetical protein